VTASWHDAVRSETTSANAKHVQDFLADVGTSRCIRCGIRSSHAVDTKFGICDLENEQDGVHEAFVDGHDCSGLKDGLFFR
jgi:hypothetical protein